MGFVTIFPGNFDNRTNVNHVFVQFVFTVFEVFFTFVSKEIGSDRNLAYFGTDIEIETLGSQAHDPSQIP